MFFIALKEKWKRNLKMAVSSGSPKECAILLEMTMKRIVPQQKQAAGFLSWIKIIFRRRLAHTCPAQVYPATSGKQIAVPGDEYDD